LAVSLTLPVLLAWAILPGTVSGLSAAEVPSGRPGPIGPAAVAAVPAPMVALYAEAASTCPGLAWSVLAAVGTVESANGTSTLRGVASGANAAGAEGPMQF